MSAIVAIPKCLAAAWQQPQALAVAALMQDADQFFDLLQTDRMVSAAFGCRKPPLTTDAKAEDYTANGKVKPGLYNEQVQNKWRQLKIAGDEARLQETVIKHVARGLPALFCALPFHAKGKVAKLLRGHINHHYASSNLGSRQFHWVFVNPELEQRFQDEYKILAASQPYPPYQPATVDVIEDNGIYRLHRPIAKSKSAAARALQRA